MDLNTCLSALALYCLMSVYLQMPLVSADCTITASKGSQSDKLLRRLDPIKNRKFKFTYKDEEDHDQYEYHFSICGDLSKDNDHVGITQTEIISGDGDNRNKNMKVVGRINNATIKGGTDWILLTYRGGDKYGSHCHKESRQGHVMITCNPNIDAGRFAVLYEENQGETEADCHYLMEMESSVACSNLKTGLSTGSIFMIVFACLIFAYISVGMLYKRCVQGAKGMEQVPNIRFWRACGNLQADGCDYLCRCQGSGFDSSRPYRGIADDQLDDEADDENLLPM